MIKFNQDPKVLRIVEKRLRKEIDNCANELGEIFIKYNSDDIPEMYGALLAGIFPKAKEFGSIEAMYEQLIEKEDSNEAVQEYKRINKNVMGKICNDIEEAEKNILDIATKKGIEKEEDVNEIKAIMLSYKLKCYELGHCVTHMAPNTPEGPFTAGRF